jgi:glycogen phosphorylase
LKPIRTFTVEAMLPESIGRLRELAHNLRWSWDHETIALFRRIDRSLWEECRNPVYLLGHTKQDRLVEVARDRAFLAHYQRVLDGFDAYMNPRETWFSAKYQATDSPKIAYFSAEFGLTECIPNYSGGLGVLAGDHLKAVSDLGLPLVAVGLLYQKGSFRQYLSPEGWQKERYPENDFFTLPLTQVLDPEDRPVTVHVDIAGRRVRAQIWRVQVGRVPLLLLDTNVPQDRPGDQNITDELYGGGLDRRIQQELILGIGGMRALVTMGYEPTVFHMNEGHSAFLALERIRMIMAREEVDFATAREAAVCGNVFTTHTPVPAGIDVFPMDLIDRYFNTYWPRLGLSRDEFFALGRGEADALDQPFNMAILAMRMSSLRNGVSRLHGDVSRKMWSYLWPGFPESEVPITSITNGVHVHSWISHDMRGLLERYLEPTWMEAPGEAGSWSGVEDVPAEELWRTHARRRERLVAFSRRHLKRQLVQRGAPATDVARAEEVLRSDALTIGFARRFATYKRANLLFRDMERLEAILTNPERPVQIILAGKAHPRDDPGKEVIRQIVKWAGNERFRRHIVFLEDYDMTVARYLVQGADIWLNTPRRPLEASGTSGMKAAMNGALHVSVLDGWWDEAPRDGAGWTIGNGDVYGSEEEQDDLEARILYSLLEREIVGTFYERGPDGLPRRWISMMKASVSRMGSLFSANRMVQGYARRFYMPADRRSAEIQAEGLELARDLARWRERMQECWSRVRFVDVETRARNGLMVGSAIDVFARLDLADLGPGDVVVEVYEGDVNASGEFMNGQAQALRCKETDKDGLHLYRGWVECQRSGRIGLSVRVRPSRRDLETPPESPLMLWA